MLGHFHERQGPIGPPDIDISGFLKASQQEAEKEYREKKAIRLSLWAVVIAAASFAVAVLAVILSIYFRQLDAGKHTATETDKKEYKSDN